MSKCEINFESLDKCGIKIDGEDVNGISRVEFDLKAGFLPKVKLTPAIVELQFGNRASVDVYVGNLESKTARMLLKSLQASLNVVNPEEVGDSLTASEALFSFAGWLTTRHESMSIGASEDSALLADLVAKFLEANELSPVRDCWPGNVKIVE